MSARSLLVVISIGLIVAGCKGVPSGTLFQYQARTMLGASFDLTRIPLASVPQHSNAQITGDYVWATEPSMLGLHRTIRIDQRTLQVLATDRPFSAGFADLLATDDSLWFSDGMTKLTGAGKLFKTALGTNETVEVNASAGSPFAAVDGVVWTYNARTQTITAIDVSSNKVRLRHEAVNAGFETSFAYGSGSIWQFSPSELFDNGSNKGLVSRIDPATGETTAEILVDVSRPTDRIRYVAGNIWILGEGSSDNNAVAVRIDTDNNRIWETVRLASSLHICAARILPKTPVQIRNEVWISTFCSHSHDVPGILLKINLVTNVVEDEILLTPLLGHEGGQPALASDQNNVWGFDGRSAFRISIKPSI